MRLRSSSATWPGASNGARCATPSRVTALAVPPPAVIPSAISSANDGGATLSWAPATAWVGTRDAAELVPDVEAGEGLAAEGVAEAVGVAQAVQQPAAEFRLALHEAGGEPALRRALDHHRGSLGADGFRAFQPAFGRAELGSGALHGQALEPFAVLDAQLQAGGPAQGHPGVVEPRAGGDRIDQFDDGVGQFGDGERSPSRPVRCRGPGRSQATTSTSSPSRAPAWVHSSVDVPRDGPTTRRGLSPSGRWGESSTALTVGLATGGSVQLGGR